MKTEHTRAHQCDCNPLLEYYLASMQSKAKTVAEYLASLPADRRKAISTVRRTIRANLPKGYEEAMNWGMITYQVPLKRYPETYNGQPLMYAALASQKNHMAVYLTGIYMLDDQRKDFEKKYAATGKKLNGGKSCVHFKELEDLPLELIGEYIAANPVDEFCGYYERMASARKSKPKATTKTARKKTTRRKKATRRANS